MDGEKVIAPNFVKPNGPAKFIEELSNLPTTKNGENQFDFGLKMKFHKCSNK